MESEVNERVCMRRAWGVCNGLMARIVISEQASWRGGLVGAGGVQGIKLVMQGRHHWLPHCSPPTASCTR